MNNNNRSATVLRGIFKLRECTRDAAKQPFHMSVENAPTR